VDREQFAEAVTRALHDHPLVRIVREEVTSVRPPSAHEPLILATGPLTSEALSHDLARMVGQDYLYFYDAISPIVLAESIDRSKVFRASRWGRSLTTPRPGPACGVDDGEGDYLNCPFTREEYGYFYDSLVHAESATVHDFDREKFFEGCLPIEVMAHRGVDTLRFGPMKPVGLVDPKTGRTPYAAVQLRQDTIAGDHYSLVGFQTQLKWGEQARVLRLIPGLERAEFVRFGMVHRNTYVNGPAVLSETWQLRRHPSVLLAGQMSGVEGYVESAASGLLAGLSAVSLVRGETPTVPPRTTAIGALAYYVSHANPVRYDPSNITFGIMPPLEAPPRSKTARKLAHADRALAALDEWKMACRARV
jgi:methylenetetrahydrofolate--tRNA-(uracil-5-)-methyltransferase